MPISPQNFNREYAAVSATSAPNQRLGNALHKKKPNFLGRSIFFTKSNHSLIFLKNQVFSDNADARRLLTGIMEWRSIKL
jgi:hypothetical protein